MPTKKEVLDLAREQLGVCETPAGSNNVKYNTAYYGQAVHDGLWNTKFPWCCVFVWWLFHETGGDALVKKTASSTTLMNWFKARGKLVSVDEVQSGDIVFYQFDDDPYADHVGIIEEVKDKTIVAIEGNTSVTSNDNGGKVMRRERKKTLIMNVVRPAYEKEEENEMTAEMEVKIREIIRQEIKAMEHERDTTHVADWAKEVWERMRADGTFDGTRPWAPISRQEAALIVDRVEHPEHKIKIDH